MTDSNAKYRNGGEGFIQWVEDKVWLPITAKGSDIPIWMPFSEFPHHWRQLWEKQQDILVKALEMTNGRFRYRLIVFMWPRGEGKCSGRGSKALMFDGSVKKVEDIVVGDLLMGDDNTPRRVLSLVSGKEEMYEVVPMRGGSMVVTADHMLSLKERYGLNSRKTRIIDMPLSNFIAKSDKFKRRCRLFKPKIPLSFSNEHPPMFDAYLLGLWLADGRQNTMAISVNNAHGEIIQYLNETALELGCSLSRRNIQKNSSDYVFKFFGMHNPILKYIQMLGIKNNKSVPHEWRTMSVENRLQFLAGYIDGDGCKLCGNSSCFSVTSSLKPVMDGIEFIARSLGFSTNNKKRSRLDKRTNKAYTCYDMIIGGDLERIPVKLNMKKIKNRTVKNWNVTGIKEVRSVGEQEYYGFMLDGNGRYVTADFTVTHNSVLTRLILMWRFFNFPSMSIMLGANSVNQVKFHHFDEMGRTIINSPQLLDELGSRKNFQQKQIQLKDKGGEISSFLRPVSSESGIWSGCSGYCFNEFHQAKNFKFFTEIDSSMRGVVNGLGVIDTTVSPKTHILYKLYKSAKAGKDPYLFFSYRVTKGLAKQFWNPEITQKYLESQKERLPFGEYERFYLNTWAAGTETMFTEELIEAVGYLGVDRQIGNHKTVMELLEKKNKMVKQEKKIITRSEDEEVIEEKIEISAIASQLYEQHKGRFKEIDDRLWSVEDVYRLVSPNGGSIMAGVEDLNRLGDIYDTDWAILAGIDRADPMTSRVSTRTIVSALAKGLAGSRSFPYPVDESGAPRYLYLLLHLANVENHGLVEIKQILMAMNDEYDGIDTMGTERWGTVDLEGWCKDLDITPVIYYPSYSKQRTMFSELYLAYKTGRFKAPPTGVQGSKGDDILPEEASVFEHNPDATRSKFGSPYKNERYGIQDDAMFSIASAIYGGITLGVDSFRERTGKTDFGAMFQAKGLAGDYS